MANLKWTCMPQVDPTGGKQLLNWHKGPLVVVRCFDGYRIAHCEGFMPICGHHKFALLRPAKQAVDLILAIPGALDAYENCKGQWPDNPEHVRIATETRRILRGDLRPKE